MVEKLGGKGNVVFFTLSGQSNTEERLKGIKDVFASAPRYQNRGGGGHEGRRARRIRQNAAVHGADRR